MITFQRPLLPVPALGLIFLGAGLLSIQATPDPASAQLIPIKTVPVASGDQFLLFPSQNLGMGGVGVATVSYTHLTLPTTSP